MPSKSKNQQRLFGQAYALKRGDISKDDIDSKYRDEIVRIADSMSLKELRKFAKTSHDGLPNKVNEFLTFEEFIKTL